MLFKKTSKNENRPTQMLFRVCMSSRPEYAIRPWAMPDNPQSPLVSMSGVKHSAAIRLKAPQQGETVIRDLVQGEVRIANDGPLEALFARVEERVREWTGA